MGAIFIAIFTFKPSKLITQKEAAKKKKKKGKLSKTVPMLLDI